MFSKPNAIIYVRRTGLVLAGKRITPARLAFPTELVRDMEVLHAQKFRDGCQKFFSDHGLRNKRVLMVLDHSIVFKKIIELDSVGKPAAIQQAFIAAMPFSAGKRACASFYNQQQLCLYATNAELYTLLAESLQLSSAKLLAITPASAYDLPADKQQLGSAIELFISDTDVRSAADYVKVQPQ